MTDKPYEIIVFEGRQARQYPNGIIRNEQGRIIHLPSTAARAIRLERHVQGQESAQEGLRDGTGAETPQDAWRKVIKRMTEIAMNETGRAATDAARMIGKASGFLQNDRHVDVQGQVNHVPMRVQHTQAYLETLERLESEVIDADDE